MHDKVVVFNKLRLNCPEKEF